MSDVYFNYRKLLDANPTLALKWAGPDAVPA